MSFGVWIVIAVVVAAVVGAFAIQGRDESPEASLSSAQAADSSAATDQVAERDARLPAISLVFRQTGFFGLWREGSHDGCRVAFQSSAKSVTIFAGDFDADAEQISETYLGQVSDEQPLPAEGSAQRIFVAIGNEGVALDDRFLLFATGGDYAQLRIPAVRDALLGLSESVTDVMLFESRGVELITDASATAASIAADMERAIELHRALRS